MLGKEYQIDDQPAALSAFESEYERSQTSLEQFVRARFLMEDGGIRTKLKEDGYTVEYATGNDVLSESIGLLMRYAVQIDDEALLGQLLDYTEGKLLIGNTISYRYSDVYGVFQVNAAIDDFRIIRALLEGGEAFSNSRYLKAADTYAGSLYATNIEENRISDYYHTQHQYRNGVLTLCYADLPTMRMLAGRDARWMPVYEASLNILLGGYISDEFPLFASKYDHQTQTYDSGHITTCQSLLTMIYLAEEGRCPEKSIEYIKDLVVRRALLGSYDGDGRPLDDIHSTANYALAAILGDIVGDEKLQHTALDQMRRLQTVRAESAVYGGFVSDEETHEAFSFDNLNALLALQSVQMPSVP